MQADAATTSILDSRSSVPHSRSNEATDKAAIALGLAVAGLLLCGLMCTFGVAASIVNGNLFGMTAPAIGAAVNFGVVAFIVLKR